MKRAAGNCPPVSSLKRDKIDVLAAASKSPADAEAALACPGVEWAARFAVYLRALPASTWELMDLEFDDYMALYCVSRAVQHVVPLLIDWRRCALARPVVASNGVQSALWKEWFAYNDRLPRTVYSDPRYRAFDTLRRALVLQDVCFTAEGPKSTCGRCYRWARAESEGGYIRHVPAEWLRSRGYRTKRCFDCWHDLYGSYRSAPYWMSNLARHKNPIYCTRYFGMSTCHMASFSDKAGAWTSEAEERARELRETDPGALEMPPPVPGLPRGEFYVRYGVTVFRAAREFDLNNRSRGDFVFMAADVERYYRRLVQYVLSAKAGYNRERAERLASQIDLKVFRLVRDWQSLQENLKVQTALLVASRTAGPLHDDTNEQLAVFRQ